MAETAEPVRRPVRRHRPDKRPVEWRHLLAAKAAFHRLQVRPRLLHPQHHPRRLRPLHHLRRHRLLRLRPAQAPPRRRHHLLLPVRAVVRHLGVLSKIILLMHAPLVLPRVESTAIGNAECLLARLDQARITPEEVLYGRRIFPEMQKLAKTRRSIRQ